MQSPCVTGHFPSLGKQTSLTVTKRQCRLAGHIGANQGSSSQRTHVVIGVATEGEAVANDAGD